MTDAQYRAFILGMNGHLNTGAQKLKWLGSGSAYADPYVIEAVVVGTPVRLSFKFSANAPLCCCINLRPAADNFGDNGTIEAKQAFENWLQAQYAASSSAPHAPYFKPFGHKSTPQAKVQDVYFTISEQVILSQLESIRCSPEFPSLAANTQVQLSLVEATQRILQRLR